jgi:hypothetical protein
MIDPPLLATNESNLSTTHNRPGGVIYHKSGQKPEALNTGVRFDVALSVEDRRREMIKDSFHNDLFLLLAQNDNPQMTAYQVRKMVEEKMSILGPALGRQQTELFDPFLSRVFWILYRAGQILPVPKELQGQGLSIDYVGRLALAMKSAETQATSDTLSFVGQISSLRPEVMDNFNFDEIAQGTASRSGMPIKYMVAPTDRDKSRATRAQQQEQAQQAQQAEAIANQVPNLSKAPEAGSPLDALMQAGGGKR